MEAIDNMGKLEFIDYLIMSKNVTAFYHYYESKLLSMSFDLDEMKLRFLIWIEEKQ